MERVDRVERVERVERNGEHGLQGTASAPFTMSNYMKYLRGFITNNYVSQLNSFFNLHCSELYYQFTTVDDAD